MFRRLAALSVLAFSLAIVSYSGLATGQDTPRATAKGSGKATKKNTAKSSGKAATPAKGAPEAE